MHLLLDEQRRRLHHEVRPVLRVLAAPYELRVEVAVTPLVGHLDGAAVVRRHHRLILGGGDVLTRGVAMREGFDLLGFSGCTGHEISYSLRTYSSDSSISASFMICRCKPILRDTLP